MFDVHLANDDCIFDSANGFNSLEEVKDWVEAHAGHFRVMIDNEDGDFAETHDPRANFTHQKNSTYIYYNGDHMVYFNPWQNG